MACVRVQSEPFDVARELNALLDRRIDVGGVGCFLGIVRDQAGGRAIASMELEHYPAMTQASLAAVAAEAERRWPLLGCTLVHRVGRLLPGDAIVLVLTASAHRQAALDATAFLIDWLKTGAPFWKKERFADGSERWVEAHPDDERAAARWDRSGPA